VVQLPGWHFTLDGVVGPAVPANDLWFLVRVCYPSHRRSSLTDTGESMSIADELKKLQDLHASGGLTDAEYAKAKEAVLRGTPVPEAPSGETHLPPAGRTIGEAANRYVNYRIAMGVIGLIVFLVIFLVFWLPTFLEIKTHQQQMERDFDAVKQKHGFQW
jgi:hypothetical protein